MHIMQPSSRRMAAVKQEPRSFTQQFKQEEVGSSIQNRRSSSAKVAAVKQETNSFTQPVTAVIVLIKLASVCCHCFSGCLAASTSSCST